MAAVTGEVQTAIRGSIHVLTHALAVNPPLEVPCGTQNRMNLADKERLRQWMAQAGVISMICLSITAPAIVISPSLPYFKIEQLLIPVVLAVYVWLLLAGVARPIRFNGLFVIGFLYCVCSVISIIYGAIILGHPVDPRDYYELPKVWLHVAFFTITYEAELSESGLRRLLAWFSIAALLVCFYAWGQFFSLAFSYKLNPYYSSGGQIDLALQYARRVYATVGNANSLGALMTWCVVLFVLAVLLRVGNRLYYSLVAFACLVTLIMTGSRYGLLTLALGLLLIFAPGSLAARRSFPKLALALVVIPIVIWTYLAVAGSNKRTIQRYQTLSNPLQVDSLRERLDELFPLAWADFMKSPLVGHGPGKSFLWGGAGRGTYIDSEYLSVLREFGAVGFLVFLAYYLYPLYLMRKGLQAARSLPPSVWERIPANRMVLQAAFLMGILALVMNLGMGTFGTPFLQGFLWLWFGAGARAAATIRDSVPSFKEFLPEAHHLERQVTSTV
jgi:O-antigen ligase